MESIKINTKSIVTVPQKSVDASAVTWKTIDDCFAKKLVITVILTTTTTGGTPLMLPTPSTTITIQGDEYIQLGQWTDETIKSLIFTRFSLTEYSD